MVPEKHTLRDWYLLKSINNQLGNLLEMPIEKLKIKS